MLPNSKRIKQWAINIDYSWFVQFWKSQLSVQMATTTKKKRFLLEALINHCSVWGPKSTGILPKLKLTEVPCQLGHPVNFEFKKISVDLWNDTTGCSSRLHRSRGTSILGEVRNVEIPGATQQLLNGKAHDFLAVFPLAHSKINQIS